MNLEQLLGRLKNTPAFMENVTHWETIPAKEAVYEAFPPEMDERIAPVLAGRGIYLVGRAHCVDHNTVCCRRIKVPGAIVIYKNVTVNRQAEIARNGYKRARWRVAFENVMTLSGRGRVHIKASVVVHHLGCIRASCERFGGAKPRVCTTFSNEQPQ